MGDIMVTLPANSLKKYLPLFEKQKSKVVLDYGSGNLRNAIFLHRRGYRVYAVDFPNRTKIHALPRLTCVLPEELPDVDVNADIALCTFVLNLIDAPNRIPVLETIAAKMVKGGYLLIETKGFTLIELDQLIIPRGFIRIHSQYGRYTQIALYRNSGFWE